MDGSGPRGLCQALRKFGNEEGNVGDTAHLPLLLNSIQTPSHSSFGACAGKQTPELTPHQPLLPTLPWTPPTAWHPSKHPWNSSSFFPVASGYPSELPDPSNCSTNETSGFSQACTALFKLSSPELNKLFIPSQLIFNCTNEAGLFHGLVCNRYLLYFVFLTTNHGLLRLEDIQILDQTVPQIRGDSD